MSNEKMLRLTKNSWMLIALSSFDFHPNRSKSVNDNFERERNRQKSKPTRIWNDWTIKLEARLFAKMILNLLTYLEQMFRLVRAYGCFDLNLPASYHLIIGNIYYCISGRLWSHIVTPKMVQTMESFRATTNNWLQYNYIWWEHQQQQKNATSL